MQQKLADYQQPTPEVSWDLLNKALASNKPKAKMVPMWTRRLAAAIVVGIVVVSAGYLILHQQNENTLAVVSQQTPKAVQTREQILTKETIQTAPESNAQPQHLLVQASSQPTNTTTTDFTETAQGNSSSTKDRSVASQSSVHLQQKEEKTTKEKPGEQKSAQGDRPPVHSQSSVQSATVIYPSDFQHKKATASSTDSHLMAKAYLSNSMMGSTDARSLSTATYLYSDNLPETNDPKDYDYVPDPTDPTLNPPTPIAQEKEERVSHRQPIRFGLTLCYRLSNRWSIESGLVYSRLSSDYTYLLGGVPYAQGEQQLNYVGIPLKVNHQLWSNRHLSIYLTAGAMLEKMVKGTLKTTMEGIEQQEDVSIRPLQCSVNGAMGLAYNLTTLMSIYAEPGVGYYFDNGSSVPTYYQEKSFSFQLNVGLRFNIR